MTASVPQRQANDAALVFWQAVHGAPPGAYQDVEYAAWKNLAVGATALQLNDLWEYFERVHAGRTGHVNDTLYRGWAGLP
jgi:hypothetical protein